MVPRRSRNATRVKDDARRDGRSYDNVVRGNKIWVSRADFIPRWRPIAERGSDSSRDFGVKFGQWQGESSKKVLDEEEVFMEVVEETNVPVEFVSNRKRVSEDSNGGVDQATILKKWTDEGSSLELQA